MTSRMGHQGLMVIDEGAVLILDSTTQDIVNNLTAVPSGARKALMNDLVVSWKLAGIWDKLDVLFINAAENVHDAAMPWKQVPGKEYLLADIGTGVSFTVDVGFTGDNSGLVTGIVDTKFSPSVDGINYDLYSRTFGAYMSSLSPPPAITTCFCGAGSVTVSNRNLMLDLTTIPEVRASMGGFAFRGGDTTSFTSGLISAVRSTSEFCEIYINSTKVNEWYTLSTSLPIDNFFLLGCANTPYITSSGTISAFYAGAALTAAEIALIDAGLTTYLTSI